MSELALKLIAEAKRTKAKKLDLGMCGLTECPDELFELTDLEELYLCNRYWDYKERKWIESENNGPKNFFSSIPAKINQLKVLRVFHCNGDYKYGDWEITDISILKDLKQLETLDLSFNQITDISILKDLTQLQRLDLSSNNITDFSILKDLKQLEALDLSFNRITDISILKDLQQLQTLDFSYNNITDISILKDLKQLQRLDLSSNNITDFSILKDLKQLETLYLSSSNITDISILKDLQQLQRLDFSSNNITDISILKDLKQLQTLDLSFNQITDISILNDLKQLETLYLSSNNITDISILKDLQQLETLYLSSNNITDISILKDLQQLETLYLSSNNITDISILKDLQQLQTLDLSSNNITDIFPILPLINKGLTLTLTNHLFNNEISLADNPLTSPPIEIVKQGNDAVINYFEELEKQGTDYIYEAKLLIVGEGGAGKTTLARKLIDASASMPKEEETTKGIDIYKMGFTAKDKHDYTINIWDFGGQEIYHATHQFFLTKRSLYILVDDTRKDDKNLDNKVFNYWLQTVELFGGYSPLLIVQNEKGDRSKDIDFFGMKKRFSFIQEQHPCNLLDNRGLSSVRKSIQEQIQQLPHIGDPIPKQWLKIRNELSELNQKKPFILVADFFEICKKYEIPEENRALALSDYLHHLGFFLHFQEDPILKQIVILRNAWATEAVYKIIDSELIKSKKGIFCKGDAASVWIADQYSKNHDELLALMIKFELCYEINDVKEKSYLIPQLLPVSRPENYHWEPESDLQLRYKYEFMPKGLFSRFIVRMHHYLTDRTNAWRSGCVLKRRDATAEIIELFGKNEISIRVRGTDSKELLTVIDETFDSIHRPLENLVLTKFIPCNCDTCQNLDTPHFYNYESLSARIKKGKITVECDKSYDDVNIRSLLYDVFIYGSGRDYTRAEFDDIKRILITEHRNTREQVNQNNSLLKNIIIKLDEAEERELKRLTTFVDQISNHDQTNDAFQKIQQTLSVLKEQVDQQEKNRLEKIEAELNKEPTPKHKLKLALNLLFLKYEVEYDAIKTFQKIKEDFKNGNWFLKE